VYVKAAFFFGKYSLNFDSGNIDSTFFTFFGLEKDPGIISSTIVLSSVHDVDARNALIWRVIGSEETFPHRVPEQVEETSGVGKGAGLEDVDQLGL